MAGALAATGFGCGPGSTFVSAGNGAEVAVFVAGEAPLARLLGGGAVEQVEAPDGALVTVFRLGEFFAPGEGAVKPGQAGAQLLLEGAPAPAGSCGRCLWPDQEGAQIALPGELIPFEINASATGW